MFEAKFYKCCFMLAELNSIGARGAN
jgi:hypothetical protein